MGIIKFNNVPSTTPGLEVETFPNYVAPEKEYQVTHVPGRNGDLVVDTKTYKNVPRPYKVSMAVEPPAVSVSGSTASFEATAERALAECKTAISSDVGKVGTTIINSATDLVENNEPYNFRAVPNGVGDRENDTLIGGTVAWNQMCPDNFIHIESTQSFNWQPFTSQTVTFDTVTNHNYLVMLNGKTVSGGQIGLRDVAHSMVYRPSVTYALIYKAEYNSNGTVFCQGFWNEGTTDAYLNVFDLTQMFGSTIADYIYGLETATAGAGIAWFRNLFPKEYYPYNPGELISVKTEAHKMVGFNQWDEQYEFGNINSQGVNDGESKNYIRSTNYIRVLPNTTYCFDFSATEGWLQIYVLQYDADNKILSRAAIRAVSSVETSVTLTVLLSKQTHYIRFFLYKTPVYSENALNTVKTCINISDPSKNGTYEPYEEHIYSLNPALELRGIPKLNSFNKLYYDGDIYSSDGSVIRKYGIVDLGSLTWSYSLNSKIFYAVLSSIPIGNGGCISSIYEKVPVTTLAQDQTQNYKMALGWIITNNCINIRNTDYTDATAFKTAMSGVYLIYELATPVIESTSGLIDNVSIASFNDGADNEPVNSLVVDITATESGSGEKSPDNPYTILGFDSGIVSVCGVNVWDEEWEQGGIDINTGNTVYAVDRIRTKNFIPVVSGQTYYFHFKAFSSGNRINDVIFYDVNKSWVGYNNPRQNDSFSVTISQGVAYIKFHTNPQYGGTYLHDISINYPSTDTQYHAYNGNTYTFAFGQTVYGGHFDNKGNLVIKRKEIIFDGSENWQTNGDRGVYISTSKIPNIDTTKQISFEEYQTIPSGSASATDGQANYNAARTAIQIHDERGMTNTAYKTFLASHNIKMLYYLATPITLAITSQDIPTLLGENNIFSNTGNIKSLSYPKQVCSFEPAQEVDDHGTEEYIDNREVAIPVGHESKYFTAGKIYNFSWLDKAGLIKEGELNADTGVLTITNGYGIVDLGSLTWTKLASSAGSKTYFRTANEILDMKKNTSVVAVHGLSCSNYPEDTWTHTVDTTGYDNTICIGWTNRSFIAINDQSKVSMTAETFKSAMHGVKLLYELADPVRTIQLTPVQVESLIGHNVLISESGNISVTPRTYSTYTEKMNAISNWLHSASGYARLEDTYEPDYYRKAYYDEQTDIENIFNEAGQATLNFICKPQRYLKSGEEPITISSGGLIQNRTRYEAYPILKVTTNNTQGSVAIGNHSITIKAGAGTDPITIDCELQDAWSGTSNKNSYIVLNDGEFPVIDPGTQTVTFDGGVQSVEVIPRWWTV